MSGNINNWEQFLTDVDPSTQRVNSPFGPSPYMTDPTQLQPGFPQPEHLNPEQWATVETAQGIVAVLGGSVIAYQPGVLPGEPPEWFERLMGITYGQPMYFVNLGVKTQYDLTQDPTTIFRASDFANLFPNNMALLRQTVPEFLGLYPPPA